MPVSRTIFRGSAAAAAVVLLALFTIACDSTAMGVIPEDANFDSHETVDSSDLQPPKILSCLVDNRVFRQRLVYTAPLGPGGGPAYLAVGDLNRDGNLDVVSDSLFAGDPHLGEWFFGDGKGGGTVKEIRGLPPLSWIVVAEMTGDGLDDIVTHAAENITKPFVRPNDFYVAENLGDGTEFRTIGKHVPSEGSVDNQPIVADFNGDGLKDVVIGTTGEGRLSFYYQNIGGAVFENIYIPDYVGFGARQGVAGDLNGDGLPDVFGAGFYFLFSDKNKIFRGGKLSKSIGGPGAIGNFGSGRHRDCAAAGGDEAAVYTNPKGDASVFVEQGFKFPGSYINDLAVADVDGNGIDDLLMPDLEKQQLIVLLGRVGGNFECRLFPIQWPASVVVGDFNNDKRPDAVIAVQPYAAAGGPDRLFMLTNTGQW